MPDKHGNEQRENKCVIKAHDQVHNGRKIVKVRCQSTRPCWQLVSKRNGL